ncbi:MAG: sugar transferase [Clostridia bacterium]|nr:sugar transferase [Clostridia bacterium]
MIYKTVKRIIDVTGSAALLAAGALPMAAVAALVRIDSPGPAIFRQTRLGLGGKPFTMYKFRSMQVGAEHTGSGVYSRRGDPRVTRVGAILRKTSVDELPQLVNILKGDMSFIGPRPVLTYHPWPFEEYTEEQKKRFSVRPGVTGWAQVNGRKTVMWDERLKYDVEYAENLSWRFDLKILKSTVVDILSARGNENEGKTVTGQRSGSDA